MPGKNMESKMHMLNLQPNTITNIDHLVKKTPHFKYVLKGKIEYVGNDKGQRFLYMI